MAKIKKLLGVLIIAFAALFCENIGATTADFDSIFQKLSPDGKNITIKAKKPTTYEEMYDLVNVALAQMVNDERYVVYGDCDEETFETCMIQLALQEDEGVVKIYEDIKVTYQEPVFDKNKVSAYLDAIDTDMWNDEEDRENLEEWFRLEDLSLINFYVTTGRTDILNVFSANLAIKYVNKLRALVDNTDFSYVIAPFYGQDGRDAMYEYTGGVLGLFNKDELYGMTNGGVYLRRVIYVPAGTTKSKEAYIAAAQKRINDYLGNESVKVSYGDQLENLLDYIHEEYYCEDCGPESVDELLDPTISDDVEDFYFVKIGDTNLKFYILEGTEEQLEEPIYKGMDMNTSVQIESSDSSVPLDTGISAQEVSDSEIADKISTDNYITYDISLYSNGKGDNIKKLTNGKFTVSIPLPTRLENKDLIVYYVAGEELETHEVTVKNGYATFETDHFSEYTLAEKIEEEKPEPSEPTEEPREVKVVVKEDTSEDNAALKNVLKIIDALKNDETVTGVSKELKASLLKAIEDGETITVDVITPLMDRDAIKDDATKIEEHVGKDANIAAFFDINVALSVGNKFLGNVTELKDAIKITLDIPDDIKKVKDGYIREYYVVRLHDGKIEKLETTQKDNTLTFETDKFSTYAIAYTDTLEEKKSESPKTGDTILISVITLCVASLAFVMTLKFRKHN